MHTCSPAPFSDLRRCKSSLPNTSRTSLCFPSYWYKFPRTLSTLDYWYSTHCELVFIDLGTFCDGFLTQIGNAVWCTCGCHKIFFAVLALLACPFTDCFSLSVINLFMAIFCSIAPHCSSAPRQLVPFRVFCFCCMRWTKLATYVFSVHYAL